jgi:hypothetical protein
MSFSVLTTLIYIPDENIKLKRPIQKSETPSFNQIPIDEANFENR